MDKLPKGVLHIIFRILRHSENFETGGALKLAITSNKMMKAYYDSMLFKDMLDSIRALHYAGDIDCNCGYGYCEMILRQCSGCKGYICSNCVNSTEGIIYEGCEKIFCFACEERGKIFICVECEKIGLCPECRGEPPGPDGYDHVCLECYE